MLKKRLTKGIIMIACMMAAIIVLGSYNKASAQSVCGGIPFNPGWLHFDVNTKSAFTDGLLGTIEAYKGSNRAGIDWLYNSDSDFNTNVWGQQIISWWTQKNGRNTSIQVTNNTGIFFGLPDFVTLHVQVLDENCKELRPDFCDVYSPGQTHIYDLGNLVTVAGQKIPTSNYQSHEGIIVITPVVDCPTPNGAWPFGFTNGNFAQLYGTLQIIDSKTNTEYGTNAFARQADAFGTVGECSTTSTQLCGIDSECPKGETCNLTAFTDSDCEDFSFFDNGGMPGTTGCRFVDVIPTFMSQNFGTVTAGGKGAADLVLMSINEDYGPPYNAIAGSATVGTGIFDDLEDFLSCGTTTGCFARLGIDDPLPVSENFTPATPTAPPVTPPPPTPTPKACSTNADCPTGQTCVNGVCKLPTPKPPTKSPGPSSSGGGCSIGGPAEIGTAMANVLVPLVPAFAIGFRVLRRRSRKNQK